MVKILDIGSFKSVVKLREVKRKYLILFTDLSFYKGGISHFNQYFLKAILEVTKDKFKVVILNEAHIPQELKSFFNHQERLSFICCGRRPRVLSKIKFIFNIILNSSNSSYVICGHINFSILCLFLKLFLKINYAVITHGIEVWQIKSILKREAIKSASLITSVSQFTAERIKEQIDNIEDKLFLLPNTVDTKLFTVKEKPKKLLEKYNLNLNKVILTVCRFSSKGKYKGYDKVIEALPKIIIDVPNIKYLLVGEGSDLLRIRKLVKRLNIEDKIVFCGSVSDEELPYYYNLCDVFVMPSRSEGFGIVFLEALSCGKPVIAGNQDGSREAVLSGKLGILVNPNNIDEIARSIISVLKEQVEPYLLDREYLRNTMLIHYGFENFSQRVKEFFKIVQRDEV